MARTIQQLEIEEKLLGGWYVLEQEAGLVPRGDHAMGRGARSILRALRASCALPKLPKRFFHDRRDRLARRNGRNGRNGRDRLTGRIQSASRDRGSARTHTQLARGLRALCTLCTLPLGGSATGSHGLVVESGVERDLPRNGEQRRVQDLLQGRLHERLSAKPQKAVVRLEEGGPLDEQRDLGQRSQQIGQHAGVGARVDLQKALRAEDEQLDRFDERVSVLRSEKNGIVQALRRVQQVERAAARVQKDPRALAPHLARLRHMAQRLPERLQRHIASEHSASHAARSAYLCST